MAEDNKNPQHPAGVFARGLAMGVAEVVPGVSGGTIALITGIYPRLIDALASFSVSSVQMLRDWRRFVAAHDLYFLLLLAGGMLVAVLAFSQVLRFWLEHYPPVVWSFFFGVIAASVWVIGRKLGRELMIWAPLGVLMGVALAALPEMSGDPGLIWIFAGGAIAVCAWILPAVSGSFMLLALGLYEPVITALSELDLRVLVVLGLGCGVGLMSFVRFLRWLLHRFEAIVMSFLCGFMAGSLVNLWPWQLSGGWFDLATPTQYSTGSGLDPFFLYSLVSMLVGALVLWCLSKVDS